MRRTYPYLNDSFYEDANSALKRRNFLKTIDNFVNQKQYVRLTLLNWNEEPLKEIQGVIASGSLSKDGSSSIRRTCSLTASISSGEYDLVVPARCFLHCKCQCIIFCFVCCVFTIDIER